MPQTSKHEISCRICKIHRAEVMTRQKEQSRKRKESNRNKNQTEITAMLEFDQTQSEVRRGEVRLLDKLRV